MGTRVPANVGRLIAQNESYAKAQTIADCMRKDNATGQWHEKHYQRGPVGTLSAKTAAAELEDANRVLCEVRRAKLRKLYDEDALQYASELDQRGLAIRKDID